MLLLLVLSSIDWTQAHLLFPINYCSLSTTCTHDGRPVCAATAEGCCRRTFLDQCDMFEYNCDYGTRFKKNEFHLCNGLDFVLLTTEDLKIEARESTTPHFENNIELKGIEISQEIATYPPFTKKCCDRPITWETTPIEEELSELLTTASIVSTTTRSAQSLSFTSTKRPITWTTTISEETQRELTTASSVEANTRSIRTLATTTTNPTTANVIEITTKQKPSKTTKLTNFTFGQTFSTTDSPLLSTTTECCRRPVTWETIEEKYNTIFIYPTLPQSHGSTISSRAYSGTTGKMTSSISSARTASSTTTRASTTLSTTTSASTTSTSSRASSLSSTTFTSFFSPTRTTITIVNPKTNSAKKIKSTKPTSSKAIENTPTYEPHVDATDINCCKRPVMWTVTTENDDFILILPKNYTSIQNIIEPTTAVETTKSSPIYSISDRSTSPEISKTSLFSSSSKTTLPITIAHISDTPSTTREMTKFGTINTDITLKPIISRSTKLTTTTKSLKPTKPDKPKTDTKPTSETDSYKTRPQKMTLSTQDSLFIVSRNEKHLPIRDISWWYSAPCKSKKCERPSTWLSTQRGGNTKKEPIKD